MSSVGYLHGYSEWEQNRLIDQNAVLAKYIYERLYFSGDEHVLEIGCGVGAQMIYLMERYPGITMTGVDIDDSQIERAKENLSRRNIDPNRYKLINVDAHNNDWIQDIKPDVVLTVWVLEHLVNPDQFLASLCRHLQSGVRFYATETYHRSLDLVPSSDALRSFWDKMINLQLSIGGNPNIGLIMGDLFAKAGFVVEWHRPFPMLFDRNKIGQRTEMLDYWKGLIESSLEAMRESALWSENEWKIIESYLEEIKTDPEAIFYYSFMQIVASKK